MYPPKTRALPPCVVPSLNDEGKAIGTLHILGELRQVCPATGGEPSLNSNDMIDAITDMFIPTGAPAYARSDNAPKFVGQPVRDCNAAVGIKTACIEAGSPWQNGYVASVDTRFRDELLNREPSCSLKGAQIVIEGWRKH